MTSWERFVNAALLNSLWQGAVIAFVLAVLLALLRRSDPRIRYGLCCTAMLALIVWPVVTASNVTQAVHGSASRMQNLERWLPFAWSLGVSICSLRFAWGYRRVRQLRNSATAMDSKIVARVMRKMRFASEIRIAVSTTIGVPGVVGFWRPVILIPVSLLTNLPVAQIEMLIVHELAHLQRWDHWVNLAQCCAQALLFYHPAVWWISKRIRNERELCCDDVVIRTFGNAAVYGRALTALEKLRIDVPGPALSAAHGSLLNRIRRLSGADLDTGRAWVPVLVAMAAIVAMLPPPQNRVEAQTQPPRPATLSQPKVSPPTPAKATPPRAQPAPTRREVKEKFPGVLDAESYAKAERELASSRGIPDSPELDNQWRTAMYEAGYEYAAHYFVRYGILGFTDSLPEYQSVMANLRNAEQARTEVQQASSSQQKSAKEIELRESLERIRQDTARLKAERMLMEAERAR